MEREVTFTMGEMKRYGVIQALLEKKMTAGEVSLALNVSTRHIKRIKSNSAAHWLPVGFQTAGNPLWK